MATEEGINTLKNISHIPNIIANNRMDLNIRKKMAEEEGFAPHQKFYLLAEEEGFEPSRVVKTLTAFKAVAFSHSAIPPKLWCGVQDRRFKPLSHSSK
jgi:hypothetical protein